MLAKGRLALSSLPPSLWVLGFILKNNKKRLFGNRRASARMWLCGQPSGVVQHIHMAPILTPSGLNDCISVQLIGRVTARMTSDVSGEAARPGADAS
jgi:hypothetical protein